MSKGWMEFGGYGVSATQKDGDKVSRLGRDWKEWQVNCEVCGSGAELVKHLGSRFKDKLFLCDGCHMKYPDMNHVSFKRIKKGKI